MIAELPVGPYRLEVSKEGFSTYVRTGIVLQVATNPTIDIQLKLGAVTEQVQVQADAALVESATTSIGQVIDNQRILELPLNGRQVYMLMDLSPGVLFTQEQFGASGYSGTRGWDTSNAYVMNGCSALSNIEWETHA